MLRQSPGSTAAKGGPTSVPPARVNGSRKKKATSPPLGKIGANRVMGSADEAVPGGVGEPRRRRWHASVATASSDKRWGGRPVRAAGRKRTHTKNWFSRTCPEDLPSSRGSKHSSSIQAALPFRHSTQVRRAHFAQAPFGHIRVEWGLLWCRNRRALETVSLEKIQSTGSPPLLSYE